MTPSPEEVAAFLGRPGDEETTTLATQHLVVLSALAYGYTRGRGFDPITAEPAPDTAAVILAATARLTSNPTLARQDTAPGGFQSTHSYFNGFTALEQTVLNRYRRRTA